MTRHESTDGPHTLSSQTAGVFVGLQLTGWVLVESLDRLIHPPMALMLASFVAVPLVAVRLVNVVEARLGMATETRVGGR